ncbi:MAG: TRAP transporter small permease [Alphaproteobacteria bacterium]
MDRLVTLISRLFGWSLLLLSAFVGLETMLRKVFNTSLQGADELGGYVLAVGSSLAFIVALAERAHIRIDLLHRRLPATAQGVLDCVAAVTLAGLGGFFLYVGWFVIEDTLSYGSTAATPWATPLIWPQGAWYAALATFAVVAIGLGLYAVRLALAGRWDDLARNFNPRGAEEEVAEELADRARR